MDAALTYIIKSGNQENVFQLDKQSGIIRTKKNLKSLEMTVFTLSIEVSDGKHMNSQHIVLFIFKSSDIAMFYVSANESFIRKEQLEMER